MARKQLAVKLKIKFLMKLEIEDFFIGRFIESKGALLFYFKRYEISNLKKF